MCAPCKGRIILTLTILYVFTRILSEEGIFIEFHNTQSPGGRISMKWLAGWFFCFIFVLLEYICKEMGRKKSSSLGI